MKSTLFINAKIILFDRITENGALRVCDGKITHIYEGEYEKSYDDEIIEIIASSIEN